LSRVPDAGAVSKSPGEIIAVREQSSDGFILPCHFLIAAVAQAPQ
jgi:hypothetical protein